MFNYRGSTVELGQNNTDIAVPFLVSTKGYGIIWNTAAFTYVDNRFPLELSFDSMAGDGVDYFLLYGPQMDDIIHQYRNLTGHAPMLPRWSYGFIQSKDRYISLDEIISIANRYRTEHIPLDVMVQDWYWWKHEGDPIFNDNYHDVPADLKKLHDHHVHTMISTWGLIDPAADTYKKLDSEGLLIPNAHVYDASNPKAQDIYWDSLPGKLFAQGWDSFWLDSAEPEEYWPHVGDAILRTKKSPSATVPCTPTSTRSCTTKEFSETGARRPTRSAPSSSPVLPSSASSASAQPYGPATSTAVSGDSPIKSPVASTSPSPACPTGRPTSVATGHLSSQPTDPAYQELYLRWFQFGVFCPIFRTHGHRPHNELWSYPDVESSLIAYDNLRYRMMPYIYSLAWHVSSDDYTIQRPLVMDFRDDQLTWNIGDQFMFGPALLVNPVTEAKATERRVYLPKDTTWYDFWSAEDSRRSAHPSRSAPRSNPTLRTRRLDPAPRPAGTIRRRKGQWPHRTTHISRQGRQLHPLSGRRRQLQLRKRTARDHPHHMVGLRRHTDHRRTHRNIRRHAQRNHLQHRLGQPRQWDWWR